MNFKVGDIVVAINDKHTVTTLSFKCVGVITGTYGSDGYLKVLKHLFSREIGRTYPINLRNFKTLNEAIKDGVEVEI